LGNVIRDFEDNGIYGDTDKITKVLSRELASEPKFPLRVAVGSDANGWMKRKLKPTSRNTSDGLKISVNRKRQHGTRSAVDPAVDLDVHTSMRLHQ
jgi:hypothetical protein